MMAKKDLIGCEQMHGAVKYYKPETDRPSGQITIRQLCNHSSIKNDQWLLEYLEQLEKRIEELESPI